ncbi:MAG: FAD-dependent thymidylate synthase [Deltaproteobacteria bacterium]|jgi:thymidylate synthase (FAD)|nr:FAD-dependent thymidylate synthase [Deltaproteobacteria bacterium]
MAKVIEPSYEILTPIDSLTVLRHIERCGRTCYQSFEKIGDDTHLKFVSHVVERHHESVIEHFSVSVKFITDRGVTHELVRHRLASYSQESTRYCNYSKDKFGNEITVIRPTGLEEGTPEYQVWLTAINFAEKQYMELINMGVKAEVARSILPNGLKTEIVASANLREWRHIFTMRTAPAAHPDIRRIMQPLKEEFKKLIPIIFDEL